MKHLAAAVLALLLLTACSKPAKDASLSPSEAAYAHVSGNTVTYLATPPETAPTDLLFIKVNPGTITIGQRQTVTKAPYFIQTSPMTSAQARAYAKDIPDQEGPITDITYDTAATVNMALATKTQKPFSLPTTAQWDYAFLSGKINQEAQPMLYEWTFDQKSSTPSWRGRLWHIMDFAPNEEPQITPSMSQKNLSFRLILSI